MQLAWPSPMCITNARYGRSGVVANRSPGELETRYNWRMVVAVFAMRLLEVMFFVGLVGSAVVVLISFIEDGKELFGKD